MAEVGILRPGSFVDLPTPLPRDEEDISAAHAPTEEATRVPGPHENPGRPGHPCPASGKAPRPPLCLRSRPTDVGRVLREARPLPGRRVVLYAVRADGDATAAFVTSRRVGGAAKRNRARRILRAAWRELAPLVKDGTEIVFVARDTIQGAKTQELRSEMEDLLRRAGALRS